MNSKNEINLLMLAAKAQKKDKSFLYYENSKAKINTIIRKNKLPEYIINYLWQSNIYKKEIIKYQTLPASIREEIVDTCSLYYSKSPWTSVLINFLKLHNPTDEEILKLLNPEDGQSVLSPHERMEQRSSIILDCWSICPETCHRLGYDNKLIDTIKDDYTVRNEHNVRRIVSAVSYILTNIKEMRMTLLNELIALNSRWIITAILGPALKGIFIDDEIIDYLIKNLERNIFKSLVIIAVHRENVSENTAAKIYLITN